MNQNPALGVELPARLASDLASAAPKNARRSMAPELSYGRHGGPPRGDAREAAVALVLCWEDGAWSIPLTVRCAALARHAGQISLPGGLIEEGETSRAAAGRELEEELGRRPVLEWIGELAPVFVYASNTLVTPCVAALRGWPAWEPNPYEVDCVLRLGVCELMEAAPAPRLEMVRGPLQFSAPRIMVEGRSAWGATAVMLAELQARLRRIAGATSTPPRIASENSEQKAHELD
jgi:8-oxo-dGTP pyrophosphatase MutT (NUDIX family)